MALPRIVFHCADQDLFDSFIKGLSRTVLVEPLRKDPSLQKRHFRGYRIAKDPLLQPKSRRPTTEKSLSHKTKGFSTICVSTGF